MVSSKLVAKCFWRSNLEVRKNLRKQQKGRCGKYTNAHPTAKLQREMNAVVRTEEVNFHLVKDHCTEGYGDFDFFVK